MGTIYEIRESLCKELETFAGRDMSRADLETVHLITDTIKNMDKIQRMSDNGYSRSGDWECRGDYSRNGMDYSNGMHYVRGHYSREDGRRHLADNIDRMMYDESLSVDERDALRRAKDAMTRR